MVMCSIACLRCWIEMGGDEGGGGGRGGETCDEEDNLSSSEKFTRLRYYLFNFSSFAKKSISSN